jgi:hypothetical protein
MPADGDSDGNLPDCLRLLKETIRAERVSVPCALAVASRPRMVLLPFEGACFLRRRLVGPRLICSSIRWQAPIARALDAQQASRVTPRQLFQFICRGQPPGR